jgi:hypothetical protein
VTPLGHKNIGRLDVPVNDAFGVSGVQRVGDVRGDFEQTFDFNRRAVDDVLKRSAFHEFHDDEGAAVVLLDVVDGTDVGMIESGGRASFALEALERLRILGHIVGKKFERDEAAEAGVLGFVHHTHAAATQLFLDTVVGDGLVDHAV